MPVNYINMASPSLMMSLVKRKLLLRGNLLLVLRRISMCGSKGELIDLLQKSGLPKQAAVRVAAGGWGALSRNDDETTAAVVSRIQKAAARLKGQQ